MIRSKILPKEGELVFFTLKHSENIPDVDFSNFADVPSLAILITNSFFNFSHQIQETFSMGNFVAKGGNFGLNFLKYYLAVCFSRVSIRDATSP